MYSSSPISRGRSAGDEAVKGYVATAKAIRGSGRHGISTGYTPSPPGWIITLGNVTGRSISGNLRAVSLGIKALRLRLCY